MKKRIGILLSIGILGFSLCSCEEKEPVEDKPKETGTVELAILEMNDVHGHVEQSSSRGGISNAAYLIDQIRKEKEYDNTVIIGNGDMLQETAISRVSYGRVVIDSMNEIGFDMMGIGNHEFDWEMDTLLDYFDGDDSNGEANFPLINSNIYYNDSILTGENISSSTIVQKGDVSVGLISYIGDVYSSINANMSAGYEFKSSPKEIADSVLELGTKLKNDGADVIVVNIHGGDSSSVTEYYPNELISQLKYKNKYLVDAVVNGHTHTSQEGKISRKNGVSMPVIQSSGKLEEFGRINLTYDKEQAAVTNVSYSHVSISSAGTKYNEKVQKVVEDYYDASKSILEEVYCENRYSFYRGNELYHWSGNLMMTATGATAAICNTGAFRNSVSSGPFDFTKAYALNPFDNHIILCSVRGSDLIQFMNANSGYYFCYTSDYGASIATDVNYTLAIVDYVYFGKYFAAYRDGVYLDTKLELRDLMIADLRLRAAEGFNIYTAYSDIKISSFGEYPLA